MKSLPIALSIFLLLSACATSPSLSREDEWAYFEHWDPDRDTHLDINEFTKGYRESKFFRVWAGRRKSVSNAKLVALLGDANGGLKRKLTSRAEQNGVASARAGNGKSDDRSTDALSSFVTGADINNDNSITQDEWARAMFDVADQNHDQSVTPIEFYLWQLLRA
jgi:hypothetical protein